MDKAKSMELGIALSNRQLDMQKLTHDEALEVINIIDGVFQSIGRIMSISSGSGKDDTLNSKLMMYCNFMENAIELSKCGYPDVSRKAKQIPINYMDDMTALLKKTPEGKKALKEMGIKTDEGSCFIATAAYGSPMAQDVIKLQEFREKILRPTRSGQLFIYYYEAFSPPLARYISRSEVTKRLVRNLVIKPLRYFVEYIINK